MKRILLLLFALFTCCQVWPQNGVFGIDFGTSKEEAKAMLERRFGEFSVLDCKDYLSISNCKFAGVTFKSLDFNFAYINGESVFNSAIFQTWFDLDEGESAMVLRDHIADQIKQKYYHFETSTNEYGFKQYKFGLNPNDTTKVTGMITVIKGEGNDGVEKLYLIVHYFPYFVDADLDDL